MIETATAPLPSTLSQEHWDWMQDEWRRERRRSGQYELTLSVRRRHSRRIQGLEIQTAEDGSPILVNPEEEAHG